MKIEEHEKALIEHIRNLNNSIEEGIEENQRNIGYNISQGSVELFAIYIHRLNIIQGSGDQFDHRIFKNKSLTEKRIPLRFPMREEILELMKKIETERNNLCYGARKPKIRIEKMIKDFQELRTIVNKLIKSSTKNETKK